MIKVSRCIFQISGNLIGNIFYLLVILSKSYFFIMMFWQHWAVLTLMIGISFSDEINQNTVSYNTNSAIAIQHHRTLAVLFRALACKFSQYFQNTE